MGPNLTDNVTGIFWAASALFAATTASIKRFPRNARRPDRPHRFGPGPIRRRPAGALLQ